MNEYIICRILPGQKYPIGMTMYRTDGGVSAIYSPDRFPGTVLEHDFDNADIQTMKAAFERADNPAVMLYKISDPVLPRKTYQILGNDPQRLTDTRAFFLQHPLTHGAVNHETPTSVAGGFQINEGESQWLDPFNESVTQPAPTPTGGGGAGFVQVTLKARAADLAAAQASIATYLSAGWDTSTSGLNPAAPDGWVMVDADDPAGTDPLFLATGIAREPSTGSIWPISGWTVRPMGTAFDTSWTAAADPDAADAAWVAAMPTGATAFRYRFDSGQWGPAIRLGGNVRRDWQMLGRHTATFIVGSNGRTLNVSDGDMSQYALLTLDYEWLTSTDGVRGKSQVVFKPEMLAARVENDGSLSALSAASSYMAGKSYRAYFNAGGGATGFGRMTHAISAGAGTGEQILVFNAIQRPGDDAITELQIWGAGNASERGRLTLHGLRK